MSRYGKYFLQHLLWLEDSFCHYYVQSDFWGRPEILDVEYVIFNYGEDAACWMVQCANWDPHTTIRRLRSFLARDCLTQYQVHRMNDRKVVRTTARELCMNAYRMVIEPKIGWAVRLDPETQEPAQPIAVEGAPEIDGMLDDLKVELDALVAGQKQNYAQWEAKLAKMSDAEKAALYGKKAGGGLYNATIGSIADLVKAAPGLAKKGASVWWTFYTYPLRLADITAEAIRTGSTEPLQKELQTKLGPVVQSAQQLKHFTSMAMVLLSEPATRDMLLDFVERYWDNTHPLEKTEMGAEAASDVVITILLAIFTAGVGAAANIAAKSGRLVKVAKMLEKLAGALRRIKSLRKLPKKRQKLGKGRSGRRAKSHSKGKGPHQPKTPDKKPDVDGKKKSGYSDNKDGPKKTPASLDKRHTEISQGIAKRIGKSSPTQTTDDLDQLFKQAKAADVELKKLTDDIAGSTNGKAVYPPGLKTKARAVEKINADYGGDASKLLDISRSSISFESADDLYKALDKIDKKAEIVRMKDRFIKPAPGGYRDVLVNIKQPNGHITELQLHSKQILDVKGGAGHKLYEQIREINGNAILENRPLSADELKLQNSLIKESESLYNSAFKGFLGN